MPNNKAPCGNKGMNTCSLHTNIARHTQENIADLFLQYDHLSPPAAPVVPNFSSTCTDSDVRDHSFLKEHCKSITDKLDKQLEQVHGSEEKCNAVYSHFVYLLYQHEKLEREFVYLQALCTKYEKEKEIMITDSNKAGVVKNTLEGLCREFQKQNKQLLIECKQTEQKEIQKREELQLVHDTEMKTLSQKLEQQSTQLQQQNVHIQQQQQEKEILKQKLCNLQEQYNTREKQIEAELKTKAIEARLLQVKTSQQVKVSQEQVLKISEEYQTRLKETKKKELDMQDHLKQYTEKFEQFQDTLSKSNEIFATFKQEMEKMTKTIARLEKDRAFLQAKCEQADITLIEMSEERNTQKREIEILKTQNNRLGALCRVLQAERRKDENEPKVVEISD